MTDNEIIKALEYCSNYNDCDKCDFEPKDNKKKTIGCCLETMKNALDLIARQQAEIERLKTYHRENPLELALLADELTEKLKTAKSEAVKEFAQKVIEKVEKARQKYQRLCAEQGDKEDEAMNIHFRGMINIVKEMVGENND